ncbi:T9SS type A sorting domain-containing protein [Lacinutrix jangbogonensis]|uniref:T9SS type A sorting domain-containing protein n=1 Tax=Lacinutrix jangbogonensis TaxID=1469557 RepID=UPI00053EB001|nr:T9SS type A sorting domain-containing protein [Lacinutrix jangbogonensis]
MKKITFLLTFLFITLFNFQSFSQNLETFETETDESTTFTDNAVTFSLTSSYGTVGTVVRVEKYTGDFGWNGNTNSADKAFIENSEYYTTPNGLRKENNAGMSIAISSVSTFSVSELFIFVADVQAAFAALKNPSGESVTFSGKLNGVQQYTFSITSFSNVETFSPNNGFTKVDFSTQSSDFSGIAIDELVVTSTNEADFLAIDSFEWDVAVVTPTCTDPDVPTAISATPSTICSGSTSTLTWTGALNDASLWHIYTGSCGGTQVGTSATNTFTTATLTGNTTFYIRGEDGVGCVDEASGLCGAVNVTVNPLEDASFNYSAATYCTGDTPIPSISGLQGGTFTTTFGLIVNASTGTIDVSASAPGTYTVTYSTSGPCPNSSDVIVTVNSSDNAFFNYTAPAYCVDATDPTPMIGGLIGGTFSSGAGLSINASTGAIDVSSSTPGIYGVTYTTTGACPNTWIVNVTINALDDASFNYGLLNYCMTGTDPTPTITGTAGGTFTALPSGLNINSSSGAIDVSDSAAATYTVTYTTTGTCPNSSGVSVTINALDNASFNYSTAAYCSADTDPTPTITGLAGGTFTSFSSAPGGLSITSGTGAIDISTSAPGTYTVTYTTIGACPNSSSVSVTVNALDDASFNYSTAAYCSADTDPTPTITGLAGGTFTSFSSAPGGLSITSGSGAIDVSTSAPGTYTVTYTTIGACPNSSSVSVTVNALDDASFSFDAPAYCQDAADPTPTITGLPAGSFSSAPGGLSITSGTGAIDVSTSAPGTYTVTYTTAGACPNSSNVNVTVNALDDASFSFDAPAYCQDDADPTPTITGLPAGSFSSAPGGLSITSGTGAIDVSTSAPGTYTVTYTTAGACPNSSNVNVTVNALDDASFLYSAPTYCTDIIVTSPMVIGLAGGTFTSTMGLIIDPNTGEISVSDSIPDTYTVTYTTSGTCPNSSSVSVTIEDCAPINDECTGAIAIACGGTVIGSTDIATDSGGNLSNDVFYSFTDTVLQDVTLSLCNSLYDTYIRVYSDCPQTNEIAGNDDAIGCGDDTQSEVTFTAQPNVTYYIMIEGYDEESGDFEMSLNCIPNVPSPGNDSCSTPTVLTLGVTLTGETTAGATDDTTGETDDTECDSYTFKSDVWYTFEGPVTGSATVTTVLSGNSDEANVAVYSSTDCSQLDVDILECSAGNGGETLSLTGLTYEATYYVRVWSDGVVTKNAQLIEGTFNITVTENTLSTTDFDTIGFTYFPNPVDTILTLKSEATMSQVRVLNMLGQVVLTETPNTTTKELDLSNLQSGAYFVEVSMEGTNGNRTKTIRVLKE